MTALEAIRMAEELLALNDVYKVAERLIVLETTAETRGVQSMAAAARSIPVEDLINNG